MRFWVSFPFDLHQTYSTKQQFSIHYVAPIGRISIVYHILHRICIEFGLYFFRTHGPVPFGVACYANWSSSQFFFSVELNRSHGNDQNHHHSYQSMRRCPDRSFPSQWLVYVKEPIFSCIDQVQTTIHDCARTPRHPH